MALGTNEVSLLDLTGAFASVRAGRAKLEPWGITAFASDAGGLRSLGPPAAPEKELPHKEQLTAFYAMLLSTAPAEPLLSMAPVSPAKPVRARITATRGLSASRRVDW
jgi:membrane carboxypeptidase/penicillin-binding protein